MKYISTKIPAERIVRSFRQLGWSAKIGEKTHSYWIFKPEDKSDPSWAVLPTRIDAPDYILHQDRIIKIFLTFFNLEDSDGNYERIYSYLYKEHYEINNRIEINDQSSKVVPYDIFKNILEKNVVSLRVYCLQNDFSLPFDKLSVAHTKEGSFIIPLLVDVSPLESKEGIQESFVQPVEKEIIMNYLTMLSAIADYPRDNHNEFAHYMLEKKIDSRIVKNFLSGAGSLSKTRVLYQNQINEISVFGELNPFLDFNSKKEFPFVNLSQITPVENNYIETLEKLEAETDNSNIHEDHAKIKVIVDEIARSWVKVTVLTINGKRPGNSGKSFKARININISDLNQYDEFTKAMPEADPVFISGEITKLKGRSGEITIRENDTSLEKQEPMF